MIKVIPLASKTSTPSPEGRVKTVLSRSESGTRVQVAVVEVDSGKTSRLAPGDRTQVAYILEGNGAKVTHTSGGATREYTAPRRAGVYVEPAEEATITASGGPLVLLLVTVPKHAAKPGNERPAGYFFEEAQLRSLVDEKRIRERTFWVNKETGLSGSWDLQLGRMVYAPHAYSPRHVHYPTKTSADVAPEHFYFIEKGTGEVKHDDGTLHIGPDSLVLIPAGEWHQLIASDSGFDYIEFQAPFDFVTTMDHDPLGKNWYIKGTDDGTGKPKLWVQS